MESATDRQPGRRTEKHPYPILEERTLPPVKGWLRPRRELAQLPPQRPGTVLVFTVNGRYEVLRDAPQLRGTEETVVGASSVSLVDISRDRLLPVNIELPSASPADSFTAVVTFMCTVEDPAEVVRNRLRPAALLRAYLGGEIRTLAQDRDVAAVNELRDLVRATVKACFELKPPRLDGMFVALADVDVRPPDSLVVYARETRDLDRSQKLDARRKQFTREQAELFEEIERRGGPIAVEAVAWAMEQVSADTIAQRAFDREDRYQQRAAEAVRILAERGFADRVSVDTEQLISRFLHSLAGPADRAPHGSPLRLDGPAAPPPAITAETGEQEQVTGPTGTDDEEEPLDEDDL
jgi:hypothetical protein